MKDIIVVGAGIGGLTTAAVLAQAGYQVLVLEAHVYPGGCAGTFFHKGFRFDAGATLSAGFYPGGPMDLVGKAAGIDTWSGVPADLAMLVHMPDGAVIPRWGDERRHQAHLDAFSESGMPFWRWQEETADAMWNLALRLPPWPPQTLNQVFELFLKGSAWLSEDFIRHANPGLLVDIFKPVASHLYGMPDRLKHFVDAQLMISAQATSKDTNSLYAASALDLPRRGIRAFENGIGSISTRLVQAIRENGGQVLFRQEVNQVNILPRPLQYEVRTRRGESFNSNMIVFNLPPWNIRRILGENTPLNLRRYANRPVAGWGAFSAYIGIDASAVPVELPLHHQIISQEELGEGSSIFLSISPSWDGSRAPGGCRAITISTHTRLPGWWNLYTENKEKYDHKKAQYLERVLQVAAKVIPNIKESARLVLPGTPVTFQRFTRRYQGWVGGFPQTGLFHTLGPRLSRTSWMVGDSIFPGQSIAGAALGGLRVAHAICKQSARASLPKQSRDFPAEFQY